MTHAKHVCVLARGEKPDGSRRHALRLHRRRPALPGQAEKDKPGTEIELGLKLGLALGWAPVKRLGEMHMMRQTQGNAAPTSKLPEEAPRAPPKKAKLVGAARSILCRGVLTF